MKKSPFLSILVCVLLIALTAPAVQAAEYMVVFKQENQGPLFVSELVEGAGGTMVRNHANIGVAIISTNSPDVIRKLRNHQAVEAVVTDEVLEGPIQNLRTLVQDGFRHTVELPAETMTAAQARHDSLTAMSAAATVTDPTQAFLYDDFQWYLRRIDADDAWALGHLGDPTVTVAIVDTGIDYTHPEMVDKVDLSRSVSFVPEDDVIIANQYPGIHPVADLNFHGTLVASQVACNAVGTACVAPNVTLVGVKVINSTYQTTIARMVSGLEYAASIEADVVSMAYTITLDGKSAEGKAAKKALKRAIKNVVKEGGIFLNEAGIATAPPFIVVDADNDGKNLILPGQASNEAVVVSASGINDEFSNFNAFGATLVDIAAPGGAVPFVSPAVSLVFGPCSQFTEFAGLQQCKLSPRYVTVLGSIPAVGIAAGVAALIDSTDGGDVDGRDIRKHLFATADDILDPGFDAFSGKGRVNALTAVTTPIDDDGDSDSDSDSDSD